MLHLHRFGVGTGDPVIALHSLTGHGGRWRALARHLPGVRVVAPDIRGHGHSSTEPPWTFDQYATDILDVLDHLGLTRAVIVGHSLGATLAVHLSRLAPDRVERLILLDPGIALPRTLAESLALDALTPPVYGSKAEAAADRARSWPTGAAALVDDEIRDHLTRYADGRWRWRYAAPMVSATYRELARPAFVPPAGVRTTLVVARHSRAVPPGYPDLCRESLHDELTVAELDCGHQIPLERPAEAAALIRARAAGR